MAFLSLMGQAVHMVEILGKDHNCIDVAELFCAKGCIERQSFLCKKMNGLQSYSVKQAYCCIRECWIWKNMVVIGKPWDPIGLVSTMRICFPHPQVHADTLYTLPSVHEVKNLFRQPSPFILLWQQTSAVDQLQESSLGLACSYFNCMMYGLYLVCLDRSSVSPCIQHPI